jgi:osmotically-inducible protein OsmY
MQTYHLNPHAKFPTTAARLLMAGGVAALASEVDYRIETTARCSSIFRHSPKGGSIRVRCSNGMVRLTGRVAEEAHRVLAEHTVGALPGVRGVDNRIRVAGA